MQSSQINFWSPLKGYVVDSKANMHGVIERLVRCRHSFKMYFCFDLQKILMFHFQTSQKEIERAC